MSVADLYLAKCQAAIAESKALLLAKLSDPASIVDVDVTGALTEASSLGDLADLAGDYLVSNAGALTVAALGALGLENSAFSALNMFFNLFANAVSVYNDLILMYLKKLAEQIKSELQKKIEINTLIKGDITALLNALISLNKGDPIFEAYLHQLRAALILLDQGRRNVVTTRNTLDKNNTFLTKTFRKGKKQVAAAQKLIKPLSDNPYLKPTATALGLNLGLPTSADQIANILAIPKLCAKLIKDGQGYGGSTMLANAQLVFYFAGLEILQDAMPDIIKKQVLALFDQAIKQINSLETSMAFTLNGHPGAVTGPVAKYKPKPIPVSVSAFKWMMDINLVVNALKLIPSDVVVIPPQDNGRVLDGDKSNVLTSFAAEFFKDVSLGDTVTITGGKFATPGDYVVMKKVDGGANGLDQLYLDKPAHSNIFVPGPGETTTPYDVQYSIITDGALAKFQLNQDIVNVYKRSVTLIKQKGNRGSGLGQLLANEGQENFTIFQQQLLPFMAECLLSIPSAKSRTAVIAEGRALIAHCDLAIQQDTEISQILTTFINTPIPLEETLAAIQAGLAKILEDLGLDAAADALKSGDFAKLFSMNGKNATYIGAALEALAFLKACFGDAADLNKFLQIENGLKGDEELLNVKITLNFDLAILKNLADCLDFTALASLFSTEEFLCGLASAAGSAAQAAGAAVAGTATTAAGAISGTVDSAFSSIEDLLTFPASPPASDGVPKQPGNVIADSTAATIAAKTTV